MSEDETSDTSGAQPDDLFFEHRGRPEPPDPDASINELSSRQYHHFGEEIIRQQRREDGGAYGPVSSSSGPEPIKDQLLRELEYGSSLEEAIGSLSLSFDHPLVRPLLKMQGDPAEAELAELTQALPPLEALRVYLYRELSDKADYQIADLTSVPSTQRHLRISDSLSEHTLGTIEERLPDLDATLVDVVEAAAANDSEDTAADLRDPPTTTAETDGMAPPADTLYTREVKQTGYAYVQLDRNGHTKYDKWELFKPYELAAKDNVHANDAHKNLDMLSRYWNAESPNDDALWNQLRECSRLQLRRMFLAAFDDLITTALDNGHVRPGTEAAIDVTGWPWFSIENDPLGTEKTKPSRNHDKSWQFATLSLVRQTLPFTVGFREIASRKNKRYNIQQLLDVAQATFDLQRLYVDKAFYSGAVRAEFDSQGIDFVMKAPRGMKRFKHLVDGALWQDETINHAPYQVNTRKESDYDDWLIARHSEKRSNLRKKNTSTGLPKPYCDWEAYYTNIDPSSVEGGAVQLTEDYRLRWAVETSYRVLKENFLLKASADLWKKRVWLFGLGLLYYNMWLAANSRKAEELDAPVKDDQGRYQMTAHRFMMSLFQDLDHVPIGEVEDLSEASDMVAAAFEDVSR